MEFCQSEKVGTLHIPIQFLFDISWRFWVKIAAAKFNTTRRKEMGKKESLYISMLLQDPLPYGCSGTR